MNQVAEQLSFHDPDYRVWVPVSIPWISRVKRRSVEAAYAQMP